VRDCEVAAAKPGAVEAPAVTLVRVDEREEGIHAAARLHVIEHALESWLAERRRADRHPDHGFRTGASGRG
jgi:hypothetical protein